MVSPSAAAMSGKSAADGCPASSGRPWSSGGGSTKTARLLPAYATVENTSTWWYSVSAADM